MRAEQFPPVVAELVKAQVDAILAGGAAGARAAQGATRTIPILTLTDDMVGQGLVASLARPGGNTTGISILATELDGKRQEILMEMVPAARRMAVLALRQCSHFGRFWSEATWSEGESRLIWSKMTPLQILDVQC